jgi:DNA mismatch repair protein MSH2
VVRVYQVVNSLPSLSLALDEYNGDFKELLTESFQTGLKEFWDDLLKFKDLVEHTIDLEAADSHKFLIKPNFNPDLQAVKEKMNHNIDSLKSEARNVI